MTAIKTFEEQYIALRKKENRLYTDEQVKNLPVIESSHPHYKEWQTRERSCKRLVQYLANKEPPKILEVGCGNGWLCSELVHALKARVVGLDVNRTELEQARRVFGGAKNLEFLNAELEQLDGQKFDIIIFAASIQYFSSLDKILTAALTHLEPNGEIHILDSNFYKQADVAAAKQRSSSYYQVIDFPGMSGFYFHHCIEDLNRYNYKILYNPNSIIHRVNKNKNPFYWISIRHA